jgi:hypothetical protein
LPKNAVKIDREVENLRMGIKKIFLAEKTSKNITVKFIFFSCKILKFIPEMLDISFLQNLGTFFLN